MRRKKACLALFCLMFLPPLLTADTGSRKILLLNSYHKGYVWSDEITRGVEDSFRQNNIELYVEYMDTKRLFDRAYLDMLEALYRDKYSQTEFDLIITSDNNAINFFNERGERLFGNLPHVYCGYNFLKPEDAQAMTGSTGINEEADIKGNIDLIMSLHKKTERIIILVENTTSGKLVQREVREMASSGSLGEGAPEIELLYDINKEELINKVRDLPENTVILLTFFFVDRDGETYSAEETAALITQYSSVPLYGSWNFSFGHGIIGGSLVSGYNQGLRAGDMALQILNGIPVKAIPVEYETPFRLKFDYGQLKKYHIPLADLPPEGEIFFRPSTFYSRNVRLIWSTLLLLTVQTLIIAVLVYLNRSRKIIQKKLTAQGIFLKLIISHIPDGIYWKDRDLKYLGCNRAYSASIGWEEEQIIGRKDSEILPDDSNRSDREDRSTMVLEKPLFDREEIRFNEKGEQLCFLKSRIPIRDEQGLCIGILGIEENVTEQKRNQLETERAEKKLRTIVDAIPGHIYVKNGEGRFLMANAYTALFAGYEKGDLEGRLHHSVRPGFKETDQLIRDNLMVLETGEALNNIQENLYSAEGKGHWFQTTKILCPPDLFEEPAVLGVSMDISALKKAEKELLNREEDLQITLDSLVDGVISTDENGQVVRMNPAAEYLTGRAEKDSLQQPVTEVMPLFRTDEKRTPINPVSMILKEMRKNYVSASLITTDREGKDIPLNFSCTPIKNESGSIRGAVLVLRDMTEELELRKRLSHREKMDTLGQLAGGITHDFNNMLGGIMSSSQLLKPYLKGEQTGLDYLNLIISTTRKAADLAKELLVFSRRQDKDSTTFDLEKQIEETVSLLGRTLDKRVSLTTELTGEYCPALGNPSQIQSALMNLGINASHAMPEGGEISLKTEKIYLSKENCERSSFDQKPGPYLKITFRDTGTGIPPEILGRIFEPFFTTKEEGKGTGLGLAAVYRTVQQHGGSIEVESREGEGTVFYLTIPLQTGEESLTRDVSEERVNGTGHILIVDDDMAMRITAKEILKDLGYRVSVAEDGKKGLDYYREHHEEVDLVILDMIMPKMNGKDCYLAMKEVEPRVKAVITSGFISEDDLKIMQDAGLSGFCRKPYTIAQLSQVIEKALSSS
ncbi:MAG: ABC transporter substrate binding protein [Spirochaetales bacterium]|nr:ABC transporter substrate binding protein [Spirochaetales bacterium]